MVMAVAVALQTRVAGVQAMQSGTRCCKTAVSTIGHARAKLSCGALSQTANGESKSCTRNKTGWRSSLRRRATIVAQHIAMAVPHVDLNTSCCRTASSTVRCDAKPTCTALRHTANGESE